MTLLDKPKLRSALEHFVDFPLGNTVFAFQFLDDVIEPDDPVDVQRDSSSPRFPVRRTLNDDAGRQSPNSPSLHQYRSLETPRTQTQHPGAWTDPSTHVRAAPRKRSSWAQPASAGVHILGCAYCFGRGNLSASMPNSGFDGPSLVALSRGPVTHVRVLLPMRNPCDDEAARAEAGLGYP